MPSKYNRDVSEGDVLINSVDGNAIGGMYTGSWHRGGLCRKRICQCLSV